MAHSQVVSYVVVFVLAFYALYRPKNQLHDGIMQGYMYYHDLLRNSSSSFHLNKMTAFPGKLDFRVYFPAFSKLHMRCRCNIYSAASNIVAFELSLHSKIIVFMHLNSISQSYLLGRNNFNPIVRTV